MQGRQLKVVCQQCAWPGAGPAGGERGCERCAAQADGGEAAPSANRKFASARRLLASARGDYAARARRHGFLCVVSYGGAGAQLRTSHKPDPGQKEGASEGASEGWEGQGTWVLRQSGVRSWGSDGMYLQVMAQKDTWWLVDASKCPSASYSCYFEVSTLNPQPLGLLLTLR